MCWRCIRWWIVVTIWGVEQFIAVLDTRTIACSPSTSARCYFLPSPSSHAMIRFKPPGHSTVRPKLHRDVIGIGLL